MTNMDLTCRISGGEAVALARHTRTPEAVAEWVALLHSDNAVEARNAAWVMTHLADEQIVALIAEKGINLARRTVAKYRDQLGIPSTRSRRVVI